MDHSDDQMVLDEPVLAPNPFLRFSYQPGSLEHSSKTKDDCRRKPLVLVSSPSSKSTGKRKATADLDENPDPIHFGVSSSSQKKKKNLKQITDGIKPSLAGSGSKKVKIYDNLTELDDHLQNGLDRHHYANPTNHFWNCLHQSGLTCKLLDPREDHTLPQEFSMGLTNLVSRPTIEQSELSKAEQISGVTDLMEKITQYQPRIVCFVGLGIAEIVKSVLIGKRKLLKSKTLIGLQPYKVVYPNGNPGETLFFAVSSTSGRVLQYQKTDKVRQFTQLRGLVEKMRSDGDGGGLDTNGLTCINTTATRSLGKTATTYQKD